MIKSIIAKRKSSRNNRNLLRRIYKQYSDSADYAQKEYSIFLKKHLKWSDRLFDVDYAPAFVFGGEWAMDYLKKEYIVDSSEEYPFVYYHGMKVYMPQNMPKDEMIAYVRSIEIEQDCRSAHCYFPQKVNLKDKVVVDIGGAEGNFAIDYIDELKSLYIFETEEKWMIPLCKTFEPWKDKVTIVKQFVGDGTNNTLKLDEYFAEKGNVDLIKIDVEGAEANVIRGAQHIISSNDYLTLFVCLYHGGNDEDEIKELLKDYHCKYRPGCMFYLWEQPIQEPYLRHGVAEFTRRDENEG